MRQQWHRHPKTLRVGIKPDVPERYIYIYIYIWHMLTNVSTRVQGHRGGLGWGVGTPPPILRSGNTKKHVLEVNWMVISGY